MRLAFKLFLASSLVVFVVVAVAAWSLVAVAKLVAVNRDIATGSVPALALEVSVRESMARAVRLELLSLVSRDADYGALWSERVDRIDTDIGRLSNLVTTDKERGRLRDTALAFGEYRASVNRQWAMTGRSVARRVSNAIHGEARTAAQQMEAHLDRLIEATESAVDHARASTTALERRTWSTVILAFIAAILAAVACTGAVVQRITRSLRQLAAATSAVAQGAFTKPLAVESADEIGQLARAFNSMAMQLREVDAMKEQFYATMSHELRSPLTSVRGAVQLLRRSEDASLTPKHRRLVSMIDISTERLLRLVNDVLDLSRINAGLLPVERRKFELDEAVTRAVEELRLQAEESGIRLACEIGAGPFGMIGDQDRIVQVLVNLIANGLRFTSAGGLITVRLSDSGRQFECQVEDTGVGIPADALPFIFERYRQAHTGQGGTGLGLSIVQAIVEAHGGRVTVESYEGKGSRFTLIFPKPDAK